MTDKEYGGRTASEWAAELLSNEPGRERIIYMNVLENLLESVSAAARAEGYKRGAEEVQAQLNELHEQVAQMCERLGDKREEIPCDTWRLRDHILRLEAIQGAKP